MPALSCSDARLDRVVQIFLAAGAFAAVLAANGALGHDPMIKAVSGHWFQSDAFRVVEAMDDFDGRHLRGVHPLFTLMAMPVTKLIKLVAGVDTLHAIAVFNAAVAALWVLLLYRIQRYVGADALAALVYTTLAAASSAAMFWFVVPETYPLGSLSILLCLALAARPSERRGEGAWLAVANLFSIGVTVTNVVAGLAATFAGRPLRSAAKIFLYSAALFSIAFALQKLIFVRSPAIFVKVLLNETQYMLTPEQQGPAAAAVGMLAHSVVMPQISVGSFGTNTGNFTVQGANLLNSGALAATALVLWLALLAAGAVVLIRGPQAGRFRFVLGATLASQIVLHLIYGEETFLYALHVAPLLVLCASLSSLARWRGPALACAAVLAALLVANNGARLAETAALKPYGADPQLLKRNIERLGPGYYVPPSSDAGRLQRDRSGCRLSTANCGPVATTPPACAASPSIASG